MEEEDETPANQSQFLSPDQSVSMTSQFCTKFLILSNQRYDNVRLPTTNGHVEPDPSTFVAEPEQVRDLLSQEDAEPAPVFSAAPEEVPEEPSVDSNVNFPVNPPSPIPPVFAALPIVTPAPAVELSFNAELEAKYNEAQAEIQRLRALLAAAPDPSTAPTEATGLRRRNFALSDDGSTVTGTDVGIMMEEVAIQPEGVPLQVVLIIALGVFITTYLFF